MTSGLRPNVEPGAGQCRFRAAPSHGRPRPLRSTRSVYEPLDGQGHLVRLFGRGAAGGEVFGTMRALPGIERWCSRTKGTANRVLRWYEPRKAMQSSEVTVSVE